MLKKITPMHLFFSASLLSLFISTFLFIKVNHINSRIVDLYPIVVMDAADVVRSMPINTPKEEISRKIGLMKSKALALKEKGYIVLDKHYVVEMPDSIYIGSKDLFGDEGGQ